MGREEMHTGFLQANLRERANLADLGMGWRIILQLIFKK
jgi:hypothetical protein